jgi:hypothetical protein
LHVRPYRPQPIMKRAVGVALVATLGRHKACLYRPHPIVKRAVGVALVAALGRHKACPYRF